uniref:Alpha-1 domain protein n=1 Tax=Pyrenopeziza brassicae TaxID=76659 RepID=O93942_PYRBR|nr:alpha-1 domain protein [Pyrenopeziza brassicae]
MSASALNTYVTAMTSPEKKALPPHKQLADSASLPDEYLMNYPILNQRQAAIAIRWQQQTPQLFYQQLRHHTTHIARRPVLPKKSLNSWMAFRSFYQNLFPHLQQKEASIYLTALWKRDPFKAKWTIIAAAYSKIRNTVGKPRAPLDRYLNIVCPQMGMIGVEAYLELLSWSCTQNADGLLFTQTTSPDLQALGQHILHSSMTEKDVVLFCGYAGYITHNVARRIVGARTDHRLSQHGLFASAPIIDTPDTVRGDSSSLPLAAVPKESGVEGPSTILAPMAENYEWTGSMSDLYHPSEGSIDFDRLTRSYHVSPWNTTNIDNPQALDTFVESAGMIDGFLAPIGK